MVPKGRVFVVALCLLSVAVAAAGPTDAASGGIRPSAASAGRELSAVSASRTAVRTGERLATRVGECGFRPTFYVPEFFGGLYVAFNHLEGSIADDRRILIEDPGAVNTRPALSADCRTVYVRTFGYDMIEVDVATGAVRTTPIRTATQTDLFPLADGRIATWESRIGRTAVIDTATAEILWSFPEDFSQVQGAGLSSDGTLLALGFGLGQREVIVLRQGQDTPVLRMTLPLLTYLGDVDFSPDSRHLLVEGIEGIEGFDGATVRVYRLDGSLVRTDLDISRLLYGTFANDDEILLCRPNGAYLQPLVGDPRLLETFLYVPIPISDPPLLYGAERDACARTN